MNLSQVNKEITLEERKKIQLEMLVEIDAFCRAHNIKYMLAFGTLLGAIRHKGYIPWDDDVDISMPLEDMFRFKREFKSENLKFCDIDTEKNYEWLFPRIVYMSTYNKAGLTHKAYGVNIDLYPTIEVNHSKVYTTPLLNQLLKLHRKYTRLIKIRRRIIRLLPINSIVGFRTFVKKYRDYYFDLLPYSGGGAHHCVAGSLFDYDVHTFPFDPFEEMIDVEFEGLLFRAPIRYDEYLTHHYGNYMKLPPEDQRHPYHIAKYYWR